MQAYYDKHLLLCDNCGELFAQLRGCKHITTNIYYSVAQLIPGNALFHYLLITQNDRRKSSLHVRWHCATLTVSM